MAQTPKKEPTENTTKHKEEWLLYQEKTRQRTSRTLLKTVAAEKKRQTWTPAPDHIQDQGMGDQGWDTPTTMTNQTRQMKYKTNWRIKQSHSDWTF